jgi:hypothetical protein
VKIRLAICAVIFALAPQSASACRFINFITAGHLADIIFVGTPITVSGPTINRNKKQYKVYFNVSRVLKGPKLATAEIWSPRGYCTTFSAIKRFNPSAIGELLVFVTKDRVSGNYESSDWFPNEKTSMRIDPRFPSGIWALTSLNPGFTQYWMRTRSSPYHGAINYYATYQIGMNLLRRADMERADEIERRRQRKLLRETINR